MLQQFTKAIKQEVHFFTRDVLLILRMQTEWRNPESMWIVQISPQTNYIVFK